MKAKNLREYKKAKKLTNKQLAKLLGISEIYTLQITAGKAPGKELALKIAETTGIPVLNLLYPQAEVRP